MPRPDLVRYGGLLGSGLLAVSAYLGGADTPWAPTITPRTILAGRDGVVLPLSWLAGTLLLIGLWWYGRKIVPSVRWAVLTAVLWSVPLLVVLPLGSYDIYSYACQGWAQAAGHDPYAAGVQALGCPWTDAVAPTWRDAPAPYGPLFLLLAAVAAATGSLGGTLAGLRVIAVLGVAAMVACLPPLARRAGVAPERAVWLVAACPLVTVHLISGAHNDAVMMALVLAGLLIAPRRLFWAGVLIGLAAAVKVTAVVVLPFAVLMAARTAVAGAGSPSPGDSPRAAAEPPSPGDAARAAAEPPSSDKSEISDLSDMDRAEPRASGRGLALRGRWLGLLPAFAGAGVAVAVVSVVSGRGFGWVINLAGSGASVQWTSPATAVGMTVELVSGLDAVPVTRVVGLVLLAGVLVLLWWRTTDGLLGAGLALAATVALAPVFHPWYAVWALAVLAAVRPGGERWLLVPCAVAAALCLPDGYNLALAVKAQGAIVMTGLVVWLAWRNRKMLV